MDRDQLNALLGLTDKGADNQADDILDDAGTSLYDPDWRGHSDHVLKLTEWDVQQGERILREVNGVDATGLDADAVADFFNCAFAIQPEFGADDCIDQQRHQFITTLLESPAYRELHVSTCSNPVAAEMACKQYCEEFAALASNDEEDTTDSDVISAVGKAVHKAAEEVELYEGTCRAIGNDGARNRQHGQDIKGLFERIQRSPRLRRIMELAGRYRRVAQARQRQRSNHGMDDMVGVTLDGDTARLLPVELGALGDEDLELDAMRRIVERQAQCRDYRGFEPKGKGPIVVCVDESGSMDGEPIANAKAFALAMAWLAKHQRRWIALVAYSRNDKGRICVLKPGAWDEHALLNWLQAFLDGGTRMTVPCQTVPNQYWEEMGAPAGKTDMVIITDGIVSIPNTMAEQFNQWKADNQVKCTGLVIGHDASVLGSVCDESHSVNSISLQEDGVAKCFQA